MASGLRHECAVFGAIGTEKWSDQLEISQIICFGLEAQQHRGQESTGIATSEGHNNFHVYKGMGMVRNVFNSENLAKLKGNLGIGHVKYSTKSTSQAISSQPFLVHSMHGAVAVAHNGELVNCDNLRQMVYDRGVGLSTDSDSELITQALCLIPPEGEVNGPDWPARIKHLMQLSPLSYSIVIMLKDRIYAVRDSYGNRPLCLGKIVSLDGTEESDTDTEGWLVASESCAFLTLARYIREILPGEIVEMTKTGIRTVEIVPRPNFDPQAFCIFEYVYFARPNSIFEGQEVYTARVQCGRQLAIEHPVEADFVGAVPESGNAAASGYSEQSGIPLAELLTRNSYVGRSFIQPTTRLRQLNVALKFSPIMMNIKNKRVILIDDSIVRGNTIGPIIRLLRKAGAKEVHVRVASPPLRFPCYMGINIPTKEELISNILSPNELPAAVGADSLKYLSVDGLVTAVKRNIQKGMEDAGHCTACMTGIYPGNISTQIEW